MTNRPSSPVVPAHATQHYGSDPALARSREATVFVTNRPPQPPAPRAVRPEEDASPTTVIARSAFEAAPTSRAPVAGEANPTSLGATAPMDLAEAQRGAATVFDPRPNPFTVHPSQPPTSANVDLLATLRAEDERARMAPPARPITAPPPATRPSAPPPAMPAMPVQAAPVAAAPAPGPAPAPAAGDAKKPLLDPRYRLLPLAIFGACALLGVFETAIALLVR